MNKLTKAAIAGGAGIILLMGGAGTFAVWNDSAVAGNATITAGTLDIEANSAGGSWSVDGVTVNMATYKIVPGDVLTYTAEFDVTAVGDNLTATVALVPGAITPSSASAQDVKLAELLDDSATFTVNGVTGTTLNAAPGPQTVEVAVSITWTDDNAAGEDNAAMTGAVNLANFGVTLTQTI